MVCLGNICRSPLAEGVLRSLAPAHWEIDSAGTAAYHIGEHPDPRSIASGKSHGIDIDSLRGRQFTQKDFDRFDRIFVMDKSNLKNVLSLARNASDRNKVDLLLNQSHPGSDLEVPDPYYGGEQGFEDVYQMIHEACSALVKQDNHDQ